MSVLAHLGNLIQKYLVKPRVENMKLVVGLGNPGKKYDWTRHNLGWLALNEFAAGHDATWEEHHKAKAWTAKISIGDEQVLLVKPLTFMNTSGQAVRALVDFYKLQPSDVIVVHDEFDLALGKMKIVEDASAGGHNGVRDVLTVLGTQKVTRLRLGIGSGKASRIPRERFVLQPFSFFEKRSIKKWLPEISDAIDCLIQQDATTCMNKFN